MKQPRKRGDGRRLKALYTGTVALLYRENGRKVRTIRRLQDRCRALEQDLDQLKHVLEIQQNVIDRLRNPDDLPIGVIDGKLCFAAEARHQETKVLP